MLAEPGPDGVIVRLEASAPRRWFAVATLGILGLLLLYLALAQPPAPGWQAFLIVLGALALWLTQLLYRATAQAIELRPEGLFSSDGMALAEMEEISHVDRCLFAFKPSNGFVVTLRHKQPRGWAPGLWWRFGKRLGIGGVTPSGPAKFMAEQIAFRLATR